MSNWIPLMLRQTPKERPASRELLDGDARRVLTVLDDERCVTLLVELADADEPLTVSALSERSGIPLSTVYRKIDDLEETRLVEEHTQLRNDGKHTSSYSSTLDHVTVDIGADVFRVVVHHEEADAETAAGPEQRRPAISLPR